MPIYEYTCNKCNKSFSLLQKVGSSEKDTVCPNCGSKEVKKKISSFSCHASFSLSSPSTFSGGG
ncbi:MAG: FmdB family zinc ribbon protein [Thermodesulfovibrionales bacterium]